MAGDAGRYPLSEQLYAALFESEDEDQPVIDPRIRLIDLNRRSLVGGIADGELRTDFLNALLDRFLGVDQNPTPGRLRHLHRAAPLHRLAFGAVCATRIPARACAPAWRMRCKPATCAARSTSRRANCGQRWFSSSLACMTAANSMPTRN
jgi:hypothetical protein